MRDLEPTEDLAGVGTGEVLFAQERVQHVEEDVHTLEEVHRRDVGKGIDVLAPGSASGGANHSSSSITGMDQRACATRTQERPTVGIVLLRRACAPTLASSRASRHTHEHTSRGEEVSGDRPRGPSTSSSDVSRMPLSWCGAAWSLTSRPSAASWSPRSPTRGRGEATHQ